MRAEDKDGQAPADPAIDAIQPLATLPAFFKLQGRDVAVAGGGDGAAWKAELLAAAGARVNVYAPEPEARMCEIARRRDTIGIEPRCWAPEDCAASRSRCWRPRTTTRRGRSAPPGGLPEFR